MCNNTHNSSVKKLGFTVVEILVVVAIFVLIITVFFDLFYNYGQVFRTESARVDIAGSARDAMQSLNTYALQADKILSSRMIATTTYSSGPTAVVFELPAVDSSGEIVSGVFDYVVFYLSGKNFYQRTEANSASNRASGLRWLGGNIAAITLTYDSVDLTQAISIDVDVQTEALIKDIMMQYRLRQQVYLRNI